jgi:mono/diheme cytochrome c family protein
MKRKRFFLLFAALAVLFGVWAAVTLRRGFSARDEPGGIEKLVARQARRFAGPSAARGWKNPLPRTPELLAEGRAHFADHCALCHGNDGRGQTEIGRNLYPKAPDMSQADTQSLSDGELFSIIKNGIRLTGMPAWGQDTPADDHASWQLVHFIRHLPAITAAEIEEMEAHNPVSPDELREQKEEEEFLNGKP